MTTIQGIEVFDVRFPTSVGSHGSDAMNAAPDYSATYVILRTDHPNGLEGHGLTFTIGRGNELCVAAVKSLVPMVQGRELKDIVAGFGRYWRTLVGDSQLRWVGPEKGVIHLATAAIVNALWDLWAKIEDKPVWKLLTDLTPEQLVNCLDFSSVNDFLTKGEALAILKGLYAGRQEREAYIRQHGYPAYTTSVGWLGYSEDKIRRLCRQAVAGGWSNFKQKVGGDGAGDCRRAAIIREEIGEDARLMMDANQVWGVDEAVARVRNLAAFSPYWIEEPTHPDDILGHRVIRERVDPVLVATGEQCHNSVMFKQFFQLQALDVCQVDSCRVGGLNEVLLILLMAAKADVPVCPHAGGVGLCEFVQHVSIFDYIAVSGTLDGRMTEYVDHLHEHFVDPVVIEQGCYRAPAKAGYSGQMHSAALETYAFPGGSAWQAPSAGRQS